MQRTEDGIGGIHLGVYGFEVAVHGVEPAPEFLAECGDLTNHRFDGPVLACGEALFGAGKALFKTASEALFKAGEEMCDLREVFGAHDLPSFLSLAQGFE